MISAHVRALGLWTPGFEDLDAWKRGVPGDRTAQPRCSVVDSRLGRGTSRVTRMAIDSAHQAGTRAGFDLSRMASVFGSALGELEIAIEQLDMMLSEEGIVSPARFKNSVHNTAAGVLSIATKNKAFTTAIAAGDHTVPMTLLEAMLLLDAQVVTQAVAVAVDEAPPEPIRSARPENDFEALGAAFALDRSPEGALAKLTLAQNVDGDRLPIPEPFLHNPCAAALGLLLVIDARKSGTYVLSSPPLAQGWSVRVECNR